VRCNRCAKVLVVPTEEPDDEESAPVEDPSPAPRKTYTGKQRREPDADDEETQELPDEPKKRKPKRKRRAEAWRLARLGLLVLIIASVVGLVQVLSSQVTTVMPVPPMLKSLNVLMWSGFVVLGLVTLIRVVGFVLCLFAPGESGAMPFALGALAATLLSCAMSAYVMVGVFSARPQLGDYDFSDPKEVERYVKEKQERLRDPKEREKHLQELEEQSSKMVANLRTMNVRLSLLRTVSAVLHGIYLISVPLLLRAFCRALNLVKLEPNCDGLLKISAGLIALNIVTQLVIGLLLVQLIQAVGWLSMLLSLAWEGLALVLMFQIWRAMPGAR